MNVSRDEIDSIASIRKYGAIKWRVLPKNSVRRVLRVTSSLLFAGVFLVYVWPQIIDNPPSFSIDSRTLIRQVSIAFMLFILHFLLRSRALATLTLNASSAKDAIFWLNAISIATLSNALPAGSALALGIKAAALSKSGYSAPIVIKKYLYLRILGVVGTVFAAASSLAYLELGANALAVPASLGVGGGILAIFQRSARPPLLYVAGSVIGLAGHVVVVLTAIGPHSLADAWLATAGSALIGEINALPLNVGGREAAFAVVFDSSILLQTLAFAWFSQLLLLLAALSLFVVSSLLSQSPTATK